MDIDSFNWFSGAIEFATSRHSIVLPIIQSAPQSNVILPGVSRFEAMKQDAEKILKDKQKELSYFFCVYTISNRAAILNSKLRPKY